MFHTYIYAATDKLELLYTFFSTVVLPPQGSIQPENGELCLHNMYLISLYPLKEIKYSYDEYAI